MGEKKRSVYARCFDRSNPNWSPDNMDFLKNRQSYANDLASTRKLTLNEVYGLLGLPHLRIGITAGWKKGDVVYFDVDHVNDQEIWIDFNVDVRQHL